MRILLTGSEGFIGKNVYKRLLSLDEINISLYPLLFNSSNKSFRKLNKYHGQFANKIIFFDLV